MLTPRSYQLEGRDFLAGRTRALLADEMRVGKSCQAVMACEKIGAENIVVVCPAIAVPHWHREFTKWTDDRICASVYSYDGLRNNADKILKREYDVAIVDECHFAGNPDAQRARLVYGKGGLGWVSDYIWALSGTPAPKSASSLWPMMKAFGKVKMDYDAFVAYYCTTNWQGKVTGTKESRIPELRDIIKTFTLRRTRKEVAPEMPAIDFQFLEIEPDKTVQPDLPECSPTEEWLEANANSMQQERIAVAHAKVLPLAKNIDFAIQNGLLKQTVCFGWHTEPLEHLTRLLNECGIRTELITGKTTPVQRERIQDNFRKGLTQVVVANIMSAGTAIDLSSASHGWFLELDWVGSNNLQAANRLVSMEKAEPVTFDVVTWPGSFDDRVQRVLMRRMREIKLLGLA